MHSMHHLTGKIIGSQNLVARVGWGQYEPQHSAAMGGYVRSWGAMIPKGTRSLELPVLGC